MNRKTIAKKSSIIGFLAQIIMTVLAFVLRKVFLQYMGVDYLGVNSTLTQILGALALSEMGIQTVIVYRLYRPLSENNTEQINELMTVFRNTYRYIALFIMVVALVIIPFLHTFLKDSSVPDMVLYPAWILMAVSSASSYLLSYNRALFLSDQKEYKVKIIDLCCNVIFSLSKIVIIILTQNFVLYVVADICFNVSSNLIVKFLRHRYYPWIKKVSVSKEFQKNIWKSISDVFLGKMSGYVFNSTDSIVVSSIIGTATAGLMGNYTTVTTALKTVVNSIASPIQNIGGRFLVRRDEEDVESFLFNYMFIIFLIVMCTMIPSALLLSDFVSIFYGNQYVMGKIFVLTLVMSLYTDMMQIPLGPFVDGTGLFKEQKKFMMVSAVINIVFSIIGAKLIGVVGVLIGTFIGNAYNWYQRFALTFKVSIPNQSRGKKGYIMQNVIYIVLFALLYVLLFFMFGKINFATGVISFIIKGCISELVILVVVFALFRNQKEFRYFLNMILKREN